MVVKHVCQRSILTTPLRISWLRRWIARDHGLGDPRTLPVLSETCTWTDTFAGPIEISQFSLEPPPLKKVNEGLDGDRCAKPLFCLHETPREKAYVKSFLTNQLLLTRTGSCTPLAFSLKQDLTSVFIGYKTNLILPFLNFEVYLSLNWQDETQLECPSFPH